MGTVKKLMFLLAVLVGFCSKMGQVLLPGELGKVSVFRDFGLGNCRKKIAATHCSLYFINRGGERQRDGSWQSSHRQGAVELEFGPRLWGPSVSFKPTASQKRTCSEQHGVPWGALCLRGWGHSSPAQRHPRTTPTVQGWLLPSVAV